jgi:hypothetical protein
METKLPLLEDKERERRQSTDFSFLKVQYCVIMKYFKLKFMQKHDVLNQIFIFHIFFLIPSHFCSYFNSVFLTVHLILLHDVITLSPLSFSTSVSPVPHSASALFSLLSLESISTIGTS